MNRRRFLHGAAALGAGAGLGLRPSVGLAADGLPTFLIVLGASGGASALDGPMAIAAEESANSATLNCFPSDAVSSVGPFRAVQLERSSLGAIPYAFETSQRQFVRKHADNMLVATLECTSVNHQVAQRRSVTGNEAWGGRTLQEIVALTHGEGLPIPNAHLATGTGFTEAGSDRSLPAWCFGEQVTDPRLFALALHGSRGVSGAPEPSVIERARAFRDDRLEPTSHFNRLFNEAPALVRYRERRRAAVGLEDAGLIDALLLTEPSGEQGLTAAPELAQIAAAFPSYENNPLEAQAALAFLLLKNRVSASVTIAPSFNLKLDDGVTLAGGLTEGALHNPPIAFDYSHTGHRSAQAFMWAQIFSAADGLIDLLSGTELQDGVSFFDRTLIYVATDFGRSKTRPAGADEFGTSHDLNNASLMISPMLNGRRVLGGRDPDTGLTTPYDIQSGAPRAGLPNTEAELFSGLLDVLNVSRPAELPTVTAFT